MIVGQCVPLPPHPIDYLLIGFAGYLVLGMVLYGVRRLTSGKPVVTSSATTLDRDDYPAGVH
jgi:hypothetical protein